MLGTEEGKKFFPRHPILNELESTHDRCEITPQGRQASSAAAGGQWNKTFRTGNGRIEGRKVIRFLGGRHLKQVPRERHPGDKPARLMRSRPENFFQPPKNVCVTRDRAFSLAAEHLAVQTLQFVSIADRGEVPGEQSREDPKNLEVGDLWGVRLHPVDDFPVERVQMRGCSVDGIRHRFDRDAGQPVTELSVPEYLVDGNGSSPGGANRVIVP